jgi:hypothetical protein
MFGAVNSLFSGLALCGVVYSILLQNDSNKFSERQFRFNHLLDIVNKQTDIFNERINEFAFNDNNSTALTFSEGVKFFLKISNDEKKQRLFISNNKETINSILPFIYHSNKFIHDLIKQEDIPEADKEKLKSLYFRNQNRFVIDYYSLNTVILEAEKDEYESLSSDLKEISKSIFDIKILMIRSILKNDYR